LTVAILGLHELSCDLARACIRVQFPDAGEAEVEAGLLRRIDMTRAWEAIGSC
jgi:hypothetical protein